MIVTYRIDCDICGTSWGTAYSNQFIRHEHRVTTSFPYCQIRITVTK